MDEDINAPAVLAAFGETMLIELVVIVGNYCTVALTLNWFDIQTPDGSRPLDE